jgi:hypothetical protein
MFFKQPIEFMFKSITRDSKQTGLFREQGEKHTKVEQHVQGEKHGQGEEHSENEQHGQGEQHAADYPPECFVVSVYQGSWYVDEVRAKESEAGVEEGDEYLLVSFMTKFHDNSFKWPRRPGLFSVLKTDVLFGCAAREGQAAVQPLQGLLSHQIL